MRRLFVLAAFLSVAVARADVSLPKVLGEHMVVQRGLPVHVWGSAAAGETVTVSFRGSERTAAADQLGRWSVYLPAGEAGGPFELQVKAANTITLKDVLVGDVWVASGQSNMEWPLERADRGKDEVAAAKYPRIRLFRVERNPAGYPMEDVESSGWSACSPESVPGFSAVAYFFGRHLHEKLNVPIGLVESNVGGTPAEAWTSLDAISADASLMPVFVSWSRMMNNYPATLLRYNLRVKAWEARVQQAKAAGTQPPPRPWPPDGPGGAWAPSHLYNGMIAPLTKFAIRGVIWYQGESNTDAVRGPIYERLFATMIGDWRRAWGQGDFPFLFVQLANFNPGGSWPELREAQLRTLALRNTGMAVTIDIGNATDIHPRNKQDVGLRLALAARAIAYGEPVEYSGPVFRQATPEGNAMRVWFSHSAGMKARSGALRGFEVAGADGKYVPAEARIDGDTVVVSSPQVATPAKVRYGWAANPDCNLYNGADLPASPFRSE